MTALLIEIRRALLAILVLAAITCGAYPLLVTLIAQTTMKHQASGSLLTGPEGKVLGSALIGQNFTQDRFFHPRPSAAGAGYDASNSGGSNLGPTSKALQEEIQTRILAYRNLNGLSSDASVPADAVTASASGLDPHISAANAHLQIPRVAKARQLPVEAVEALVAAHTRPPVFGIFGESRVVVLELNLALERPF